MAETKAIGSSILLLDILGDQNICHGSFMSDKCTTLRKGS